MGHTPAENVTVAPVAAARMLAQSDDGEMHPQQSFPGKIRLFPFMSQPGKRCHQSKVDSLTGYRWQKRDSPKAIAVAEYSPWPRHRLSSRSNLRSTDSNRHHRTVAFHFRCRQGFA